MLREFLFLLLLDGMLYIIVRVARSLPWTRHEGVVPLYAAIPLSVGAFCAHTFACVQFAGSLVNPEDMGMVLTLFVVCGLPPVVAYVDMMTSTLIHTSVNNLYGWASESAVPSDFSRAREMAGREEYDQAVHEYWKYYRQEDGDPRALLAAAALRERACQYNQAVEVLREVMARCENDGAIWEEAAYRLANILEHAYEDDSASRRVLREIVRRNPNSETGHLAGARLIESYTT